MITNLLKSGFNSKGITDTEEMLLAQYNLQAGFKQEPHRKSIAK